MNGGAWVRVAVVLTIVGVLLAVAAGLSVVGSPENARLEKLDRKRLGDLRRIVFEVNAHWVRYQSLPEELESLKAELSTEVDLRDPETGIAYGYRVLGSELFEVCATFATKCPNGHRTCTDWRGSQDPRIESHGAGEECFRLRPLETP